MRRDRTLNWVIPDGEASSASLLASELALHPLSAQVLFNRGLTTAEAVTSFLADRLTDLPDPMLMKGMDAAVARLLRAIETREPVTLYGDYDVDGVCATGTLSLFLEEVGARVETYIPKRLGEGYGLNVDAIDRIVKSGASLLVTLDCGISAVDEVAHARAAGLDVVIVDHHQVPETLPPANVILNPHQPGCGYPTRHLCAAGVAFNLCMALRKAMRERNMFAGRKEPNLKRLLDMVALATVADVVPLVGANRVLVRHGLEELGKAERPGIEALKEVCGLPPKGTIASRDVGFKLGPRINAAGRLDDASLGLRLLRARSLEEARPLAQALDDANAARREIEQRILEEAFAQAEAQSDELGLVLAADGWHAGVIGIVASRVVDRFHRPTVCIALEGDEGKGSARSIEGFDLVAALGESAAHLVRYGGHRAAAGLTLKREELQAFREVFSRTARARLQPDQLVRSCRVDAVVRPAELDDDAVAAIEALGPFGCGNPEPVLAARRLDTRPRLVASRNGAAHLKLSLQTAPHLDAIGFGMGDRLALTEGPVDLAFNVGFDHFRGQRRLSLRVRDLRAADLL